MTKKIAIILPYRAKFSPRNGGGMEIGVYYQNREYPQYGPLYKTMSEGVTVYGGHIETPYDGVAYQPVSLGVYQLLGKNGGYCRALNNLWRRGKPDLIEVHNRVNVFKDLVRQFPEIPVMLYLHNDPQSIKGLETPKLRQAVLVKSANIICCSHWVKKRFCEGLSGPVERVVVVVNGVPRPWDKMPAKEKLILFPNRLITAKGTEIFAEALAEILPRYPEWRCLFVGLGDGDVLARINKSLKPLGAQAKVQGLMPYEDVLDQFGRASIIGVPVFCEEAFGRTAAEALSSGAALISTDKGGLADILERAGIRVEPTVSSLKDALELLLGNEELLLKEQKKSWDNFDYTIEQSSRQLMAVRQAVLGNVNHDVNFLAGSECSDGADNVSGDVSGDSLTVPSEVASGVALQG